MNPTDSTPSHPGSPSEKHPAKAKSNTVVQGDFTASTRLIWLSALAIPIGALCALVAIVLQRLIGLFTNIFYFHEFKIPDELVSPASHHLGLIAILVPVVGGLIVGLMAKYGSDKIRGHGIPEALEAILIGGSRMSPKVAVLKPLSSAVAIGSGGPFGAEGPIIMTGGACGSVIAQIFHLTSAERKTLLVAGAAGGMAATFGTPLAAVLLAVEVMLFEWKPRSLIPVALSSATAALLRPYFFGPDSVPLVHLTAHPFLPSWTLLGSTAIVGLSVGVLSLVLTAAVYATEDAFHRLPIHWMWWPMIGGLAVGIGGYFEPRALGVGYDVIFEVLKGDMLVKVMLGLMVAKALMWALALGSGTSGGVLAPLLMCGGILGALEANYLPGHDVQLYALVGMAAVMGGTMRAPLTGAIFALELTYDTGALVPLLVGSILSYGFTVLTMKRSILTEKVARRGYHISQEFGVDPLERLSVAQVMSSAVVTIPAAMPIHQLVRQFFLGPKGKQHQGYPVVAEDGSLLGVITKSDLLDEWADGLSGDKPADAARPHPIIAFDMMSSPSITALPEETCRAAVERMVQTGVGRLVVVDPDAESRILGMVTRSDVLKSRSRLVDEEESRERFYMARRRLIGGRDDSAPKSGPPRKTA
jgi:chloride channel protein, CIC family